MVKKNQLTDISQFQALGLVTYCPSATAKGVKPERMKVTGSIAEVTFNGSCYVHDAVKALIIKRGQ